MKHLKLDAFDQIGGTGRILEGGDRQETDMPIPEPYKEKDA